MKEINIPSQLSKQIILSVLLFIGMVKASPINFPEKNFEDLLFNTALRALNEDLPTNQAYRSGKLLHAKPILKQGAYTIWDVSVILNPDCSQELSCPQDQCDLYIKQDQFNNLIVEDQSKQCNYNKHGSNFNYIKKQYTREVHLTQKVMNMSVDDPIIKQYIEEGSKKYADESRKVYGVFITVTDSASKQDFGDRIEYKIVFRVVVPTCIEKKTIQDCSINEDSLSRICTINVIAKPQIKYNPTIMTTECAKNLVPLKNNTGLEIVIINNMNLPKKPHVITVM